LYGTSSANLSSSVDVAGANTTTQVISGLAAGTYYFAIETLTTGGVVSGTSAIASGPAQ